jgi:hypothetical protein
MKNVSLSFDDVTIERMRQRAEQLEMTYSAYIRWLVKNDYFSVAENIGDHPALAEMKRRLTGDD